MLTFFNKNTIILNHLYELKYRFFYYSLSNLFTIVISYEFSNELIYLFVKPLLLNETHKVDQLIYTNITEAFFTFINISIFFSFYLTFPILLYHIYIYIIPGLYDYEKKKFILFLLFSILSLIFCLLSTYYFILPVIWSFFLDFDNTSSQEVFKISFEGKINEYVTIIQNLFFSFTFCSQIPILLFILIRCKILTIQMLIKGRTLTLIICFILGALLSPPDIFSQFFLAIPLYLSFEISILISIYIKNSLKTIL